MRRFELAVPDTLDACLAVLAERGAEAKPLAGGTDLIPQVKNGMILPAWVVDLSGIAELAVLEAGPGGLRVGAAVTARRLELDLAVRASYQALADGAAMVGSIQVRNLATLGGNICNAAPSADMAPPLLALDAEALVAGLNGRRSIPMADFFLGVRRTALQPGELLLEVRIPAPAPRSGGSYMRLTPRRELDIAVVGVASQVTLDDGVCRGVRIALASVAPIPFRATAAEALLEGREPTPDAIEAAASAAMEAARPISDQRGSIEYRRHLVRVLTRRTLTTALARALA